MRTSEVVDTAEVPLIPPQSEDPPDLSSQNSSGLVKTSPAFHLLIPASERKTDLCKTLLSAFVLGYPAPILINWGKSFGESEDDWAHGHTAKIRGVLEFLNNKASVKDDDLVLIVDGYDVWFQLPPQILIDRYHTLSEQVDRRLKNRYGVKTDSNGTDHPAQKYKQSVVFGADKICWPNPKEDPACAAIPYSTLPKDAYGPQTDRDRDGFFNRPRFLNSGNVMGPASDVRDIYHTALKKVEEENRGHMGDQLVFAEIFGEQEFQRETKRIASQSTMKEWMDWLSTTMGTSESPLAANITINNMTVVPGQRYEFSIGLDYESRLFQTVTHSMDDVAFITYNSSAFLTSVQATHNGLHGLPLFLPNDLQIAQPPCTYSSPGNHTDEAHPDSRTLLLPYSPNLDTLTPDPSDPRQPSWRQVPLATNIISTSIPVLLHVNGDKSPLKTWWPRMWFHRFARALLRRFIRSTQGAHAAESAAKGGLDWWDRRGGRGGVWTDTAEWMGWSEVCRGHEAEIFGDGKGEFGKEEGDGKLINSFGRVVAGSEEERKRRS